MVISATGLCLGLEEGMNTLLDGRVGDDGDVDVGDIRGWLRVGDTCGIVADECEGGNGGGCTVTWMPTGSYL